MPLAAAADAPAATPFATAAFGPPLSGVGKAATEEEGMTVLEVRNLSPACCDTLLVVVASGPRHSQICLTACSWIYS